MSLKSLQVAFNSFPVLVSSQVSITFMVSIRDDFEMGQETKAEATSRSVGQGSPWAQSLSASGTTEQEVLPRPDVIALAEAKTEPSPRTQGNSQECSRISRLLPGSVYLWACGERGRDEEDTSLPLRSEAAAAWIILLVRKVE